MAKKINEKEFEDILNSIAQFSDGATLDQIMHKLQLKLTRRSLQRRLAKMVKKGHIIVLGMSRARKYKIISDISSEEKVIPLSAKAIHIQQLVNRPINTRKPVFYNKKFLDSYKPNITRYLSEEICGKLLEMGKTDIDKPSATYARKIFNKLLIDLSWNSSRLEGNTYSLLETERLLELNEIAEGKDFSETQMILNHKAAIEFIIEAAVNMNINRSTVLNIHALLSDNLLKDPTACGRLRTIAVAIAQSVYNPPDIPNVISECFDKILNIAATIQNPLEQAFFLMVQLPYLQPFEDVNKRVSRLVANIPLIHHNLAPLSFMDLPQKTYVDGLLAVYELNNVDLLSEIFVWAYERSCDLYTNMRQTLGKADPFKLHNRSIIIETVVDIVKRRLSKKAAIVTIKMKSTYFTSEEEQKRFIDIVEKELKTLHEGNIARYKLTDAEFFAWHTIWIG
jgi:Fic family protein